MPARPIWTILLPRLLSIPRPATCDLRPAADDLRHTNDDHYYDDDDDDYYYHHHDYVLLLLQLQQ